MRRAKKRERGEVSRVTTVVGCVRCGARSVQPFLIVLVPVGAAVVHTVTS